MSQQKTLYMIDGNAVMYRSFYAISHLATREGVMTNALYGFVALLLKINKDYRPDSLIVAFDSKGPTKRHEVYADYKLHRKPMPDDLVPQMAKIKDVLRAFRVPVYESPGYEADDILATFAKKAEREGYRVFIVTGDKDMMQLVNDHIFIVNIHKNYEIYGYDDVVKHYGVAPEYIADFLALVGDSSDHIPGVPGVGEKTAIRWIQAFGHVEDVLKRADELPSLAQRDRVKQHAEEARMSKALAMLDCVVPMICDEEIMPVQEPDKAVLKTMFHDLEFGKFSRELGLQESLEAQTAAMPVLALQLCKANERPWDKLSAQAELFFIRTETRLMVKAEAWTEGWLWEEQIEDVVFALGQANVKVCGYGLKPYIKMWNLWDKKDAARFFDVRLAAYLLDSDEGKYELLDLTSRYAKLDWREGQDVVALAHNVAIVEKLAAALRQELHKKNMYDLYSNIEQPLMGVLAHIEHEGVKVDEHVLHELSHKVEQRLAGLTAHIYQEAGVEFNINSPKQLGEILFEHLKMPGAKKTKTGYGTSVDILEKLAEDYSLPKLILEYRQYYKLKTTYMDALPKLIDAKTGRIHTTLNQEGVATGRLSSTEPNLQNIPIRTQEGRDIRKAFIADGHDCVLVSADYSQIELRILAHMSGDERMTQAFLANADIHRQTAVEIFGVAEFAVTEDMRRMAKAINFGLIYGKTPFGLAKDLNIPLHQAKSFIDAYFAKFPRVKAFIENLVSDAQRDGCVRTMFHRVRYVRDINAKDKMRREFAERMAMNSPLQGTAADIIKIAMLNVHEFLQTEKLQAKMILQIHDELLFEVPRAELDHVKSQVCMLMEKAVTLSVPLVVNISQGSHWAEAH